MNQLFFEAAESLFGVDDNMYYRRFASGGR